MNNPIFLIENMLRLCMPNLFSGMDMDRNEWGKLIDDVSAGELVLDRFITYEGKVCVFNSYETCFVEKAVHAMTNHINQRDTRSSMVLICDDGTVYICGRGGKGVLCSLSSRANGEEKRLVKESFDFLVDERAVTIDPSRATDDANKLLDVLVDIQDQAFIINGVGHILSPCDFVDAVMDTIDKNLPFRQWRLVYVDRPLTLTCSIEPQLSKYWTNSGEIETPKETQLVDQLNDLFYKLLG